MTTFPQVLSGLLARDAGRPLVTFYDDATGERTELSVTTYANWVAKVASLLVDELEIEHGSRLRVDLPAHWLAPVVMGAAWAGGLEVVWDGAADGSGDRTRRRGPVGRRGVAHPRGRERAPPARRTVLRAPAGRRPRPRGRGVVAARRVRRMAGARGRRPGCAPASPRTSCGERPPSGAMSPTAAASSRRRVRLPLPVSLPSSNRWLAAVPWSWSPTSSEHRREQIAADERVTARFDPGQPARS